MTRWTESDRFKFCCNYSLANLYLLQCSLFVHFSPRQIYHYRFCAVSGLLRSSGDGLGGLLLEHHRYVGVQRRQPVCSVCPHRRWSSIPRCGTCRCARCLSAPGSSGGLGRKDEMLRGHFCSCVVCEAHYCKELRPRAALHMSEA